MKSGHQPKSPSKRPDPPHEGSSRHLAYRVIWDDPNLKSLKSVSEAGRRWIARERVRQRARQAVSSNAFAKAALGEVYNSVTEMNDDGNT